MGDVYCFYGDFTALLQWRNYKYRS